MKCEVISAFWDKNDSNIRYSVGDVIDWDDKDRVADAEKRGLIKRVPEKKKTKKGAE